MADRSQWTVMTVEHRETAEIPSRNNQIILNQLREITGNSDVIALQQALQAAQGDVSQAVALLTETPNQNAGCALSSSQSHRSLPGQSQSSSVIDLTGDDKDDLQRAIALSLQETSERAVRADLTTEEQDISRVLEESLAEASGPGGVKRKRDSPCACSCPREADGASGGGGAVEGDVAVSAVRAPGAPVGLKNVGNTCWFSAVVQSLFNLPGFRRLILGFTLPDSRLQNPQSENERVGLCFMRELRVLFALMVGSVRGFVDPSPAVHILKGAFRGADTQQDVSEFTHKLLDWLEDAFRISAEESRDDSLKTVNPMVDLFYGRARSIGTNQGKRFAVLEGFGPLPVRVSGFHDLHECLEHATMAGDIEQQQQPPACASSGQELWFSELPPVLTLELSRFRFNTEVGRPEKIHSRLEFPDTIYMDRYMESNKEVTRIKRDEIRRLSEQQSHLQQTLARYQNYGSGPQRYPLVDILSCALQFASTPPVTLLLPPTSLANHKGPSSAAKSPCTLSTNHVTTSPTVSSSQLVSTNNIALFPIAESTAIPSTNHVVSSPAASPIPEGGRLEWHGCPAPQAVTALELETMRAVLSRWNSQVQRELQDLQDSICRIKRTIDLMYTDKTFRQLPYRLHAVLVHDGQAMAGHYWAYVREHARLPAASTSSSSSTTNGNSASSNSNSVGASEESSGSGSCWRKFNDVRVSRASWAELVRDSYGGGARSASAYCLVYVNARAHEFTTELAGEAVGDLSSLSPALRDLVAKDNHRFLSEMAARGNGPERPAEPDGGDTREPGQRAEPREHEQEERRHEQVPARAGLPPAAAPPREGEGASREQERADKHSQTNSLEQEAEPTREHPRVERVVEVSIPDVGTIVVQAEEHGYNDEVMLTPAMQGVLMAVARARLVREAQGPEATLIEAFRVEYARLRALAQESYPDASSPASPPLAPAGTSGAAAAMAWRGREERLEHVVIYLFQNEAPNRVVERALLEQFADRNLSYDEQLIKIMKVAQAKLQEISPEDMDPAEYQKWHQEYELFRQVCVYLVMGIEKYQEGRYTEALPCLMHAHAVNEELLARGQRRGVRRDVLARYRRVCVRRVNEACALTFGTGDVAQATRSLAVMTELVLPAMALLAPLGSSCEGGDAGDEAAVARESDLCAVELMRDRWCSYLGRDDMASELQELLTDFLPRLLDYQPEPAPPTQLTPPPLQGPPPPPPSEPRKCESSGDNWRGLRAPPRLKAYSPHTLAEKMAEVLRVNRPREA
ncbi:unnamed protein product [Lampetra planeri]